MSQRGNLLDLREKLSAAIAAIDAALGELPEPLSPDPSRQSLVVVGVCTAITAHALERYRERTGTKKGEVATINKIRERLERSEEWRLKEKFRLIELLAHGRDSKIWRQGDMLFIIEDGVIVTCHTATADRWEPKSK